MTDRAFSGVILSDFTADLLRSSLELATEAPVCRAALAGHEHPLAVLQDGAHPLWSATPDFLVVWTLPEAVMPSFRRVLDQDPVPAAVLEAECALFVDVLRAAAGRCRSVFVPTWTVPAWFRGAAPRDYVPGVGVRHALLSVNKRLADGLAGTPNVFVLDTERWLRVVGEKADDPRLWYLSKVPFDPAVFREAARDIRSALRAVTGGPRKVVFLDLDNTLWGGVVGDDGWAALRVGGHDAQGEAFADLQRMLLRFRARGILLAIASKNDEATALEALRAHPEMILAPEAFAAWRINWQDKAENIRDMLLELNLGPDAAVFIDDNPAERDRVRRALPEILVPEWPDNPLLAVKALQSLDCFDTVYVGEEDRGRAESYHAARERRALKDALPDEASWRASLGTVVSVERLSAGNLPRAVQLLNKTNQMNLATRRMDEESFRRWAAGEGRVVLVFRVRDRFGDAGLTGLVSAECRGPEARLVDFLLSCRVFGRQVENVMLAVLLRVLRPLGAEQLTAVFVPTEKNGPCRDFLEQRSGGRRTGDGVFGWRVQEPEAFPDGVIVEEPKG